MSIFQVGSFDPNQISRPRRDDNSQRKITYARPEGITWTMRQLPQSDFASTPIAAADIPNVHRAPMTDHARPLHGVRVLVVEDHAMVARMIADMLERFDCAVVGPTGTVPSGLALVRNCPRLDVAILNVDLGHEKVWPVADELRSAQVPFLFVCGYSDVMEPRFADVPILAKPFSVGKLEQALLSLIRKF